MWLSHFAGLCHFAQWYDGFLADFYEQGYGLPRGPTLPAGTTSFREESGTDLIFYFLKTAFPSRVLLYRPYELATGADIELHFLSGWKGHYAFRIQAKRIYHHTSATPIVYRYDQLLYRPKAKPSPPPPPPPPPYQCETLKQEARRLGMMAAYLLYNSTSSISSIASTAGIPRVTGCMIADAQQIWTLTDPSIHARPKDAISDVAPICRPWSTLFCPPHLPAGGTPNAATAASFARTIMSPDSPAPKTPQEIPLEIRNFVTEGIIPNRWREGDARLDGAAVILGDAN